MSVANPDSAYRRILLGRAAVKVKIRALESTEKPSERLLTQLVRSPDTHPRIRLMAADLLRELRRSKSIDEILQAETSRLEGKSRE